MTRILVVFSLIVLSTAGALAQVPSAGVPRFLPVGTWSVEPTALTQVRGLSGIKLPCMAINSYDNGFIVRLSGGGQKLLAMAIDFRQSAFHQGRKYPARLIIDQHYSQPLTATAFSENVLIFNLRNLAGLYQALESASVMALDVDGNIMEFSIGGLNHVFAKLETCFGGTPSTIPAGMPLPVGMPPPVGGPPPMPGLTPIPTGMGDVPEPPRPGDVPGGPHGSASPEWNQKVDFMESAPPPLRAVPSNMLWEAKAGDDLRMTLERWSSRAGVDVAWQSDRGGRVVNDIRVNGSFEDAVQSLMAQNATAMGIEANMVGGRGGISSPPPGIPQPLLPTRIGGPAMHPQDGLVGVGSAKWHAPAGSSLQQVLNMWSARAGVGLIWQSNQPFTVKRAVNANGSYESALQSLLNQYAADNIRPAAQLNNDPISGERVLFIQSSRVL